MKSKRRPSGSCPKCGTWRLSLHRDHIVPKFKGGSDDESNVQYICANCHEDKTRDERIGLARHDLRGRAFSDQHRQRLSASLRSSWKRDRLKRLSRLPRGEAYSAERRNKISAAMTRWWKQHKTG